MTEVIRLSSLDEIAVPTDEVPTDTAAVVTSALSHDYERFVPTRYDQASLSSAA